MNTLPPKVAANKFITNTLTTLWTDMLEDGCYLLRKYLPEIVTTVDNNIA
jgi:hypothetical protein